MVGDAARPWRLQAPALWRPRHLAALVVNRDLLDIGLGRAQPHPQDPVEITRYLAAPALSLADVGAYALGQAGLGRATPRLAALEITGELPPARTLLRRLASVDGRELSDAGRRWLGLAGEGVIGGRIGPLIGSAPASAAPPSASGPHMRTFAAPAATDTAIMSDSSESTSPPPARAGGGRVAVRGRRAERPAAVPETAAAVRLAAIQVRPA